MDYEKIKKALSEFNATHVEVYVKYLKQLETELDKDKKIKNWWFAQNVTEQVATELFKQVALDNLYIDGETITIGYKGKVLVTYNYQAYKNRVLNVYPESLIDLQIVNNGDTFNFRKDNGHVLYTHVLANPFDNKKEIIGAYCIIKNRRGEFIELLNQDEIKKMKATATTQNVWNNWESEMVKKSAIKRACKTHFKDITTNIDTIDNENFDVELSSLTDKDMDIRKKIDESKTVDEILKVYNAEINNFSDKNIFIQLCTTRKKEILEQKKDEKGN